ncbi:hypothetical protein V3G39_15355 [Dermatophilaceae bacterium Sec6.4]
MSGLHSNGCRAGYPVTASTNGPALRAAVRHLEDIMSKRARKRRSRKGKSANHGKKPNA